MDHRRIPLEEIMKFSWLLWVVWYLFGSEEESRVDDRLERLRRYLDRYFRDGRHREVARSIREHTQAEIQYLMNHDNQYRFA